MTTGKQEAGAEGPRAIRVLTYAAASSKRRSIGRILRWSILSACVVALPFLVESGLDYGHAFQSCAQCGARSTVRFASLFGIGGEYNRNVTEGPISRLIQDSEGITCNHRWELYGDNTGGILRRCRGVGVGATRFHHVTLLEALPTFEGILRERVKRDPSFADRLKNAIQLPYETSSKAMLDELWTAAMDSMDDLDLP